MKNDEVTCILTNTLRTHAKHANRVFRARSYSYDMLRTPLPHLGTV